MLVLMGIAVSTREALFHHDEKLSALGMEIYYTKGNCAACHVIAGLDEEIRGAPGGAIGPALTDEADVDKRQVGGFLEWQIMHLKDPAKLSPGSIMPPAAAVGLTENEMIALVHFLGDHTKGLRAREWRRSRRSSRLPPRPGRSPSHPPTARNEGARPDSRVPFSFPVSFFLVPKPRADVYSDPNAEACGRRRRAFLEAGAGSATARRRGHGDEAEEAGRDPHRGEGHR